MNPLFSIIVPVYKAEAYLRQCVDSVLAQTCGDFEVILVDDGSPDGSGAICDEYAARDDRVKVIHKENGGNVSARRAAYALCTGRYIVHVDSDDYIDPSLLEWAEKKITENNVDGVLFGFVHFDGQSAVEVPQAVPAGLYRDGGADMIRRNLICGEDGGWGIINSLWSVILRREIFLPCLEAVPATLYKGEDLAATAPALAACNALFVLDRCLYYYRKTPGSITNVVRGDELEQALLVADFLEQRLDSDYQSRLDGYVAKRCYITLKALAMSQTREDYRKSVQALLTPTLQSHLKGARCGGHISDWLVFFLLRRGWFGLFRLIVMLRN